MVRVLSACLGGLLALFTLLAPAAFAQDGYRIRSGDTLRIEVVEDPGLNRSSLVAPDGRISVPLAGGLRASGRTIEEVQSDLAARLAANFATVPTVFISIERLAELRSGGGTFAVPTITIYVMGEAAKPGKLAVSRGTTLLQLFAEMGGFSKFAATRRIQLRRGSSIYAVDYDAIEAGTASNGSTKLIEGDVIVIPQRKLFE